MSLLQSLMLAAVAPVEELPPETVQALPADAAATVADAGGQGISYLQLLLEASLPVQVIMLLLAIGSVLSWVIIFRKNRAFAAASDEADEFVSRFWSGVDLTQLYRGATAAIDACWFDDSPCIVTMIPNTVPTRPTYGAVEPMLASSSRLCSWRSISRA